MLQSFNLVKWSQHRGLKKFNRNGITEKTFDKNGHHLHYFEGGKGETIVLVHGFGGDAQVTWEKSILDLSKDHHVLALDLLWFGKSYSDAEPTLNAQLAAIKLLLDHLQLQKATVVGVSYGGFVSMALAYHHPQLVKNLVLVDSPGLIYNSDLLSDLCAANNVESVDEIFVPKNPVDVQRLFDLALYKNRNVPKRILQEIYDLYFAKHHKELTQLITSLPAEQANYDFEKFLEKPNALVIWGEEDAVFPSTEGERLANYLNASFISIPKAGHALNVESFKRFQKVLRTFLEE